MKIAIVGSRSFTDYDYLVKKMNLLDFLSVDCIISGGAKGADTLAEKYANDIGVLMAIYPANWKKYGKKAGFIRNKLIVDESDVVIAFWDGESTGTKDTIEYTTKMNKKLHIFTDWYKESDQKEDLLETIGRLD